MGGIREVSLTNTNMRDNVILTEGRCRRAATGSHGRERRCGMRVVQLGSVLQLLGPRTRYATGYSIYKVSINIHIYILIQSTLSFMYCKGLFSCLNLDIVVPQGCLQQPAFNISFRPIKVNYT